MRSISILLHMPYTISREGVWRVIHNVPGAAVKAYEDQHAARVAYEEVVAWNLTRALGVVGGVYNTYRAECSY